ncbi:hypothetical protein [Mycolicibacterium septicum]|uniref:hypothetical protein n=1 Tax=Mycolicibacterium septicum TaxID=98668 RepID=UPI001AF4A927|nr:hypothetical protein [Mycolicibacterium septicum]QRY51885.1 hypothetical protein JVX95_00225 [Mycolicibacterium septicum]
MWSASSRNDVDDKEDEIMWWMIPVVVIAFDMALFAIFATVKRRRLRGLGTAPPPGVRVCCRRRRSCHLGDRC